MSSGNDPECPSSSINPFVQLRLLPIPESWVANDSHSSENNETTTSLSLAELLVPSRAQSGSSSYPETVTGLQTLYTPRAVHHPPAVPTPVHPAVSSRVGEPPSGVPVSAPRSEHTHSTLQTLLNQSPLPSSSCAVDERHMEPSSLPLPTLVSFLEQQQEQNRQQQLHSGSESELLSFRVGSADNKGAQCSSTDGSSRPSSSYRPMEDGGDRTPAVPVHAPSPLSYPNVPIPSMSQWFIANPYSVFGPNALRFAAEQRPNEWMYPAFATVENRYMPPSACVVPPPPLAGYTADSSTFLPPSSSFSSHHSIPSGIQFYSPFTSTRTFETGPNVHASPSKETLNEKLFSSHWKAARLLPWRGGSVERHSNQGESQGQKEKTVFRLESTSSPSPLSSTRSRRDSLVSSASLDMSRSSLSSSSLGSLSSLVAAATEPSYQKQLDEIHPRKFRLYPVQTMNTKQVESPWINDEKSKPLEWVTETMSSYSHGNRICRPPNRIEMPMWSDSYGGSSSQVSRYTQRKPSSNFSFRENRNVNEFIREKYSVHFSRKSSSSSTGESMSEENEERVSSLHDLELSSEEENALDPLGDQIGDYSSCEDGEGPRFKRAKSQHSLQGRSESSPKSHDSSLVSTSRSRVNEKKGHSSTSLSRASQPLFSSRETSFLLDLMQSGLSHPRKGERLEILRLLKREDSITNQQLKNWFDNRRRKTRERESRYVYHISSSSTSLPPSISRPVAISSFIPYHS